ncbi:MAG TPA: PDZ domain-containing protein [Gammaproteobacteria bacterium]|jgi:C-terminal processing protease CtpA/Prc|nr:PDZ domain-containing protein [Gammaproteobacteria bacterium]
MNSLKFTVMMLGGLATLPPAFADSSAPPAPSKGTPAPSGTVQDQQQMEQQLEQARQQLQQDARRVAELSMQLNGDAMTRMAEARARMENLNHRGFLGIDLGDDDDAKNAGVTVSAVTPGGPAEKAGLREGDVITGINGTSFKASGDDGASDKLVEFMRDTKPGDTLKVAYTRGGKSATANVTAGNLSGMGRFAFSMPPMPPIPPMAPIPPMPPTPPTTPVGPWRGFNMFFGPGSHWGEMQLVAMTPGLGQYFGTDKGLLVLHMPKDSVLQLQEGDVIVQVGGRDPGNAPHAMRILSSYGPGESVKLDIMRKGKPVSLNVTMPKAGDEDSSSAFNWSGLIFDGGDDGSDQGR